MQLYVFDEGLCNVLFSLPTFITIQEHSAYASFFEELYKYYVTPSATSKIMQQSMVLKLIYMLCTENEVRLKNTAEKNSTIINEAIDFIEKNLSSDLKLENVAKEVSLLTESPTTFPNIEFANS